MDIPHWVEVAMWTMWGFLTLSEVTTAPVIFKHGLSRLHWLYQVLHILWVITTALLFSWTIFK
jgi:hypothetical protein